MALGTKGKIAIAVVGLGLVGAMAVAALGVVGVVGGAGGLYYYTNQRQEAAMAERLQAEEQAVQEREQAERDAQAREAQELADLQKALPGGLEVVPVNDEPAVVEPVAKVEPTPSASKDEKLAIAEPKKAAEPKKSAEPVKASEPTKVEATKTAGAGSMARVKASGADVALVGDGGRFAVPASVPEGKYSIEATFPGEQPVKVGSVRVPASGEVKISCNSNLGLCKSESN